MKIVTTKYSVNPSWYIAWVKTYEDIITYGETEEEAKNNLRDKWLEEYGVTLD